MTRTAIVEAQRLEIARLRAEAEINQDEKKQVNTLPDFIDQHYQTRRAFASEIGSSEQWVYKMGKLGYIVINGKPYMPAVYLAKKMENLNLTLS